jgi:ATP-dependent DNA helicase RecG
MTSMLTVGADIYADKLSEESAVRTPFDPGESLPERVSRIVVEGESYEVEFKGESRAPLNEDDGTVTGARPRHEAGRTDPLRLQALIANTTQPALPVTASTVQVSGHEVLVVEVPDSPRVVGTTRGLYVRRALASDGSPTCLPYHSHEMLAHEVDRGAVDWAGLYVSGAEWTDLDPLEFERLRQMVGNAGGGADRPLGTLSDREVASALGFTRHDAEVTTGALLLFGKVDALRRFLPSHEAAFQVMRGLDVEVNDFLPYPLLRLAEEMLTRFRARNSEEDADFGLLRVAVSAYSETAFREALANALVHRDYTRRGAVHVQWTADQLEISSPGGFPAGIRLDNLLVAPPHPRSPLLADAFKRAGLVERTGRGINRMFAEQLRVGRPAPDYGRTSGDDVVAILPGGPANMSMTKWVLEQENQQGTPLRLQELQVLAELQRERQMTTAELAAVMQRTDGETRSLLTRMVERGWVQARGAGKGRSWHLSAAVYRVLDAPSGYVRVHGFEPLQQEQMILQYVEAHGQITRNQAADLCGLSPDQANRALRRLVSADKLGQQGENKGRVYMPPVRPNSE